MKVMFFVVAVVAAAACAQEPDFKEEWEKFKNDHSKTYKDDAEEAYRMKIFKESKIRVGKHNARFARGEVSFTVAINRHSDMLSHEVAEQLNGFRMDLAKKRDTTSFPDEEPVGWSWPWPWPWGHKSVDWREKGFVTDVKDQGQCGCCWAFSATGSLEGQMYKKTGKLVSLSEQNLVDCSDAYGNNGCSGGLMDQAFQYIQDYGGVDTERSYPYKGVDGNCAFNATNVGGTVTDVVPIRPTEKDLMNAVTKIGPISVAIDSSNWSFQHYQSGIYYEEKCSTNQLDHGVLVVGYGSDGWGKDYWIVKNSWGSSWGEQGYIKMARNRNNNCGIATQAIYPTV